MPIIESGRAIEGSGTATPLRNAGAPTSGVGGTYAGIAVVGSKLIDTTNGKAYICTAYVAGTNNITWTVVGAQT
jgi:hypothetical protein